MNIAVICSDERMQQVYDNLSQDFMVDRLDETSDYLHLPPYEAMIFPVQGVDAFGYVTMHGNAVHIPYACYAMQGKDCLLFAGMRGAYLEGLPQRKVYYMEEEPVIHDNAILTAEGVLHELIGCTQKSIYDIQVDVVGYGHCGKVIYELLKHLQVKTRVIRRACDAQEDFLSAAQWAQCGDIVIHTATGVIITKEHMRTWNPKPIILDIATPNLIDLKTAQEEGIPIIKTSNLPGRFACISAGNILAKCIRGKLTHGK